MLIYLLNIAMMALGVYCLIVKRNIIKKIIGLTIMEYSINLFLIMLGYRSGGIAPIITHNLLGDMAHFRASAVDPLPQALVLTSIVIGLGTLALMAALSIRLYEKYGTFDMSKIKELRG